MNLITENSYDEWVSHDCDDEESLKEESKRNGREKK